MGRILYSRGTSVYAFPGSRSIGYSPFGQSWEIVEKKTGANCVDGIPWIRGRRDDVSIPACWFKIDQDGVFEDASCHTGHLLYRHGSGAVANSPAIQSAKSVMTPDHYI